MSGSFFTIMMPAAAAVFLFAVVIGILVYDRQKTQRLSTAPEGDWLFSDFQHTVFNLCYGKADSDSICGINIREYERYCKILHRESDLQGTVALRIEGVVILLVCCLIGFMTMSNIVTACVFLFLGVGIFYAMWELPYSNLKNEAQDRLYRVENDMPRFLSLMEKAMDLPIDQAMLVTAQKFDSPLAEDILDSLNKVALGANGWQETLYDLAKTYDIEAFSDMVLAIINAYDQGTDIRRLVNEKIAEVEEDRLYAVEAHDSRTKSIIFLPIMVFEVLPLMVLIVMPMLSMYM